MQNLECRYFQNSTSCKYVDGEVDLSLFSDNIHLNGKGSQRLFERLTGIPNLHLVRKVAIRAPAQQSNLHRSQAKYASFCSRGQLPINNHTLERPRLEEPRRHNISQGHRTSN